MSLGEFLKLLSTDICVACLRILHCNVQAVILSVLYVPEQMSCHRGKE